MMKSLPIRGCVHCLKPFRPRRMWQRFCSLVCRKEASKEDRQAEYSCEYCSMVADTVDHIPPTSIRPTLIALGLLNDYPFIVVRACRECNSALGDKAYWTIEQRKEYIAKWIEKRYREYLVIPYWSKIEIDALDYKLRQLVNHGLAVQQVTLKRLDHATNEGVTSSLPAVSELPERVELSEEVAYHLQEKLPIILSKKDRLQQKIDSLQKRIHRLKSKVEVD